MTKYKYNKRKKQIEKEFKKLRKFSRYIGRVFKFEDVIKNQRDFRKKRNYETSIIFIIVFWAFVFRVESFNKLEEMLRYGCFNPLFPKKTQIPSIDTVSRVLAKWDLESLSQSFERILRTLYLNKNFNNGTIDDYTVCAIDGTDVIHTTNRKCPNCIYMRNLNGYGYAHKSVVAMVIGREVNYVVGNAFLSVKEKIDAINKKTYEEKVVTKSENEFACAKKLLSELPKWIDVIVADALYFNAPFFKSVLNCSKHAVVRLKDKTTNAYNCINLRSMYHTANDSFRYKENKKKFTVSYWFKDTVAVDSKARKKDPEKETDIRVYKFIEVVETTVKNKECFEFKEIYVGTTNKNIPPKTIWKIIHYRWYIENTCFHQLKTHCSMEHCFVHDDTAIKAISK